MWMISYFVISYEVFMTYEKVHRIFWSKENRETDTSNDFWSSKKFEDFEIFYFFDQETCSICCPLLPFKVWCESFRYIGNLIWQIGEKEIFLIDLHLFWFTMKIFIFDFAIFQFYICKSYNCCPLLPYNGCMKQLCIIRKLVWHMNEKEYTYIHFQLTGFDLRLHLECFQMSYFLS